MSLESIFSFLATFAGVDVVGQINTFQDSFGYSILVWLLLLAGVI